MKPVWLLTLLTLLAGGCATTRPQPLALGDIIALTQAGLTDEELTRRITDSRTVLRLGANDVVQLRQAGVSERVVDELLDGYVRFAAAEQRRADLDDEEWHHRYGFWYRRPWPR